MQITITAKTQIIVNEKVQSCLDATSDTYRDACNYVSDYVYENKQLTYRKINDALYCSLRANFNLKSQMAQSVIKTVVAKYKTTLENEGKWIKATFRKPQYDLVWNRDYSLLRSSFSLNTLEGRIQVPYIAKGMEKYFDHDIYKFGTAKLVRKHGKYFLHIPVTFELEDTDTKEVTNVVGIDRGINFVVATYDSKGKAGFISGREIKQKRAQYAKTRKELQQRKTPSARRRLKATGQRENRWMQDVNHCISKALVKQNPKGTLFVLEDLTGVRNATECVRRKDRYVSVSWSFFDLEQKLNYKAKMNGNLVIKVDPAYTSQRCPKCGHTEKSNRDKKNHIFCCKKCGYKSNDDRIGAMNLYKEGMRFIEEADTKAIGVSTQVQ